ncbi:hydroxymethylglutaryl-CoA synthase family protein [Streptomyces specialis]|uniref:hydroxymethylglutaryl-CoA synthase family protein n=1 Tax=Streptomyces specialis TaxID=498367 RepID=UPI00073E4B3C|nr:hydroxymethylglutaryl-CoA synthase [Streptomyces specialis]
MTGIEAINVYCGLARLPVPALFAGRGLDPARLDHLMMTERSVGLPCEDPVSNAVNAARPVVDALSPEERDSIELLVTSSESGIDYSKSIASYVHAYLGLGRNCRVMEVKQACYAATGVLQLAAGYLASGVSPGARALVIATDVSMADARAGYAEPATGHGAAALLIGPDARVLELDPGAFGLYSYETLDSARPEPDRDIADVDASLFAYLDCLSRSFADYRSRVADADWHTTFTRLALHTPFAGLVKAGHRKLTRELTGAGPDAVAADFAERVAPSLHYPSRVGNLCSGSVYLALCSLIDHLPPGAPPQRIGLFSYGSGCASEFFSGLVGEGARQALAPARIGERLAARVPIGFDEYTDLLAGNSRCLLPVADRDIDLAPYERFLTADPGRGRLLVHRGTKNYHRTYEWV